MAGRGGGRAAENGDRRGRPAHRPQPGRGRPGASVEVRVPPFVAVQCIAGPRHPRHPPNVVGDGSADVVAIGDRIGVGRRRDRGRPLRLSGSRAAEIAVWFPLVPLP